MKGEGYIYMQTRVFILILGQKYNSAVLMLIIMFARRYGHNSFSQRATCSTRYIFMCDFVLRARAGVGRVELSIIAV